MKVSRAGLPDAALLKSSRREVLPEAVCVPQANWRRSRRTSPVSATSCWKWGTTRWRPWPSSSGSWVKSCTFSGEKKSYEEKNNELDILLKGLGVYLLNKLTYWGIKLGYKCEVNSLLWTTGILNIGNSSYSLCKFHQSFFHFFCPACVLVQWTALTGSPRILWF